MINKINPNLAEARLVNEFDEVEFSAESMRDAAEKHNTNVYSQIELSINALIDNRARRGHYDVHLQKIRYSTHEIEYIEKFYGNLNFAVDVEENNIIISW